MGRFSRNPKPEPVRTDQVNRIKNAYRDLEDVADGADEGAPSRRSSAFNRAKAVLDKVESVSTTAELRAAYRRDAI